MAEREPDWIPITELATAHLYEREIDLNARPGEMRRERHRKRVHTGEPEPEWVYGPPPSTGGKDG